MFKKPKLRKIVVAICALALLMGGVVYASTYFSVHDGPTWDDGNNIYRTGVCSDTAYGETACTQYTTDGTDLSYSGNNPSTWNGTKLSCSWADNDTTCPDTGQTDAYWRCDIPETASATIKYRFYVVNQTASGNCSYNGAVYYGQGTSQSSFNTGPSAITLRTLTTRTGSALPFAAAAAAAAAAVAVGGLPPAYAGAGRAGGLAAQAVAS